MVETVSETASGRRMLPSDDHDKDDGCSLRKHAVLAQPQAQQSGRESMPLPWQPGPDCERSSTWRLHRAPTFGGGQRSFCSSSVPQRRIGTPTTPITAPKELGFPMASIPTAYRTAMAPTNTSHPVSSPEKKRFSRPVTASLAPVPPYTNSRPKAQDLQERNAWILGNGADTNAARPQTLPICETAQSDSGAPLT